MVERAFVRKTRWKRLSLQEKTRSSMLLRMHFFEKGETAERGYFAKKKSF